MFYIQAQQQAASGARVNEKDIIDLIVNWSSRCEQEFVFRPDERLADPLSVSGASQEPEELQGHITHLCQQNTEL